MGMQEQGLWGMLSSLGDGEGDGGDGGHSWANLLHHLMMNDPNRVSVNARICVRVEELKDFRQHGSPPASQGAIDALPKRVLTKIEADDLDECTISQVLRLIESIQPATPNPSEFVLTKCVNTKCVMQEPFEEGDEVITMPCAHEFKAEPLKHWLLQVRTQMNADVSRTQVLPRSTTHVLCAATGYLLAKNQRQPPRNIEVRRAGVVRVCAHETIACAHNFSFGLCPVLNE
jgi:hypothetical protein